MKNLCVFIALASLSVLVISCEKETDPYSKIVTDNPLQSHLDSLVHNTFKDYAIKSETVGFSLAVIDGSQINYYNYGETKKGNKILADENTLYELASVTKPITALALLYWLNENFINVNTAIKTYLPQSLSPNLSLNGVDITFKHLLNHTSGMPLFSDDMPPLSDLVTDYDSIKVYNYISTHPLLRTPGTTPVTEQEAIAFYSSLAYGLAGIILERQTKQPLQDVFENIIFQPLQMPFTTLDKVDNITNRAYPHNKTGLITYSDLSGYAGCGNLRSNLSDLAKFAEAQINATNDNSLGQAILQSQDPTIQINLKDYYALGWEFYYTTSGKELIFKGGKSPGFTAIIVFDKISEKAMIGLFNNYYTTMPGTTFFVLVNEYFK